ncbi:carboxypeptidase S [Entamoeba marina]
MLLVIIITALSIVLALLYFSQPKKSLKYQKVDLPPINTNYVSNLQQAIQIKTVTGESKKYFEEFNNFLKQKYPLVFDNFEFEIIYNNTFILTYKHLSQNNPLVFLAHHDVIAAPSKGWKYDPFCGYIKDGKCYGRGCIDNKGSCIAIFESIESLLKQQFQFKRPIIIVSSDDEEKERCGCREVVKIFKNRNIKPYFILDEGYFLINFQNNVFLNRMAPIGICDKGKFQVKVNIELYGGHASIPPNKKEYITIHNFIEDVVKSIEILKWTKPLELFFQEVSKSMPFPFNTLTLLFTKSGVVGLKIFGLFGSKFKALTKTICSLTYCSIGKQSMLNALPITSTLVFDIRTLPGDSYESVSNRINNVIKKYENQFHSINLNFEAIVESTTISDVNCNEFNIIETSIKEVFNNPLTAPSMVVGGTDSSSFSSISNKIYRFLPFELTLEDISRMHGKNEQIKISSIEKGIQFYKHLITKCQN